MGACHPTQLQEAQCPHEDLVMVAALPCSAQCGKL
jgi:hypothetical protein